MAKTVSHRRGVGTMAVEWRAADNTTYLSHTDAHKLEGEMGDEVFG